MKIRVKHKETEFIVEDDNAKTNNDYSLVSYNQDYVVKLLKEMTDNIIKIMEESNKWITLLN